MHNRARLFLPAIPYLIGVGLQVSGLTHPGISIAAFEIAAVIAAAVTWSYWAEWHHVASNTLYGHGIRQRVLSWPGFRIPKIGTVRPQLIAALLVLILCNASIVGLFKFGEHQQLGAQEESANSAQLSQFYGELGTFLIARLPDDMTDEQYAEWQEKIDIEVDKILKWMRENMAHSAEYRFADVSGLRAIKWPNSINAKHNQERNMIFSLQKNLLAMMATTAWDKPKQ
jgi:hypothetical protein